MAAHVLAWAATDGGAEIVNMGFPLEPVAGAAPGAWVPTSRIVQQQAPLLPTWGGNRTLALAAHGSAPAPVHAPAPAPAPSRRTAPAEPPPAVAAASNGDVAAVPAPSARQPPSATRSRTPATHGPTHGPAAGYANGNSGR